MAGIPHDVLEHFRRVPLFSAVSKGDLRAIVSAADEMDQPAGTVLVREGEFRSELFVITAGTATATMEGREVGRMGPGDFFGEIALLCGGPRTATVTAETDVSIMILAPGPFMGVLRAEPHLLDEIMRALGERLRTHEPAPG
jgi:CRP/FNR family transcriptional regulator, cyclic AMP receptor protein